MESKISAVIALKIDGKKKSIKVCDDWTVKKLQEEVSNQAKWPMPTQITHRARQLVPSDSLLKSHGIKNEDKVVLDDKTVKVVAHVQNGKKINVELRYSWSVAKLRLELSRRLALPSSIRVVHDRLKVPLESDGKLLAECAIHDGDELLIINALKSVYIMLPGGQKIKLQICDSWTIGRFIREVASQLALSNTRFLYKASLVAPDNKLLLELNISEEDTIVAVERPTGGIHAMHL